MATTNGEKPPDRAPFSLRAALAVPPGWPPDVAPGQIIRAAHINAIRDTVYAWPGDVDGQSHTLRNVNLVNATGVLADPTTAAGDLIARGAAGIGRLPIGTAGQVLTVDAAQPQGMRWAPLPPSGVSSVFGRQGAIVAQAGDYTVAQITGAMADPTTTKGDLIARSATAAGRLPLGTDGQVLTVDAAAALGVRWGAPAIVSVFGRTGAVTPQTGDYTAMMVTNAVSTAGSYPDPPWIPNYSYSKLIGVPASFPPAAHTHDAAAIVSGVFPTARLGTGVADATVYLRGDGTWAAAGTGGGGGVISVFGRAGNVIAQSGDYTAAMVTGAVTDPTTQTGDLIVRSNLNVLARLPIGANGQVLQTDTSLSVGMKWTSITGSVQTPWVTDHDAANFQLFNARRVGVGLAAPNYPIDVVGDINYTGVLRVNGAPVSFGGAQTPWTSDINAANFRLFSVNSIGIGVAPPQSAPLQVASHTPGSTGSIAVQDLDASASGNPVLLVSGISSEGTRCWAVGNRGGATFAQNFYLWNDRASDILIGTNGAERMRVTAAGNVGVGTAVPRNPFQVHTGVDQNLGVRFDAGAGMIGFGSFNDAGTVSGPIMYNATKHFFQGAVGVGVLTPQYQLHVASPTAPQFAIGVDSNPLYNLQFTYDAGTSARIQSLGNGAGFPLGVNPSGGNVGIGTASPVAPLSLGYQTNDPNLRSYANMDQGCFAFYVAQNFPATNNFQRVLDIVAGGLNSGGNIRFMTQVGGAAAATAMFINPAGNVGIGTQSLSFYRLSVVGNRSVFASGSDSYAIGIRYVDGSPLFWMGSDLNGDCIFSEAGGSERMRIKATGNVGIGTNGPTQKLSVLLPGGAFGTILGLGCNGVQDLITMGYASNAISFIQSSPNNALEIRTQLNNPILLNAGAGKIGIGSNVPTSKVTIIDGNPSSPTVGAQFAMGEATDNPNYRFTLGYFVNGGLWKGAIQATNNSVGSPLCLNPSGGAVGIGTVSPTVALHISAQVAGGIAPTLILQNLAGAAEDAEAISFWSAGAERAQIRSTAHGADGYTGTVEFWTGVTTLTEKMRLSGTGNLGIGTNAPGYPLHVIGSVNITGQYLVNGAAFSGGIAGMMIQINGGGPAGPFTYLNYQAGLNIVLTGSTGGTGGNTFTLNIGSSSDMRLKRNIQPLAGGLALVERLRPIRAEWNGLASTREGQPVVSIVAQELREVIPDAVAPFRAKLRPEDEAETELLAFDQMAIVSHLILAVQQLARRLKELDGRESYDDDL